MITSKLSYFSYQQNHVFEDATFFFCKWAKPGLFLFIFIVFKATFYRKSADGGIAVVEGEHNNHFIIIPLEIEKCYQYPMSQSNFSVAVELILDGPSALTSFNQSVSIYR